MISYGITGNDEFDEIQKEAVVGRFIVETFKDKALETNVDDVDTQDGRRITFALFKEFYDIDIVTQPEKLDDIIVSIVTLKGYNDIIKGIFIEDIVNAPSESTFLGALKESVALNDLIVKYYQTLLIHIICIKLSIDRTNYIEKDSLFDNEINRIYLIVKKRFIEAGFDFDITIQ